MCNSCAKYGYFVERRTLTKRVRYATNHMHVWGGWSVERVVYERHRNEFDAVRIICKDRTFGEGADAQLEAFTLSAIKFDTVRADRKDADGNPQYFVADKHWNSNRPPVVVSEPEPPAPPYATQSKLFGG